MFKIKIRLKIKFEKFEVDSSGGRTLGALHDVTGTGYLTPAVIIGVAGCTEYFPG
jgi:hypothetical protein